MKINSISLISLISILGYVASANASVVADFYIGGMAGVGGQTMFSDHKNKTEASRVFGAIAGMDLPIFRVEAEYDYFASSDFKRLTSSESFPARLWPSALTKSISTKLSSGLSAS